jgi:CheY-like chemotaxis protein/HPt (histidine-containing phosphotransfer) domain-containing protein
MGCGNYHPVPTILVVDDEPSLRCFAEALLQDLGYAALLAESGRAAVQLLLEKPEAVAAVLLDMTMPGMRPEETFRLLREIRPDLPVIILSGDTESAVRERFGPNSIAGYIQKPYSDLELEATLAQVLTEPIASTLSTFRLVALSDDEVEAGRQEYLAVCRRDLAKTANLIATRDFESLRVVGHSLKGSGGCFGYSEVTRFGKDLEGSAQAGDAAACGEQLRTLAAYLERLNYENSGAALGGHGADER